MFTYSLVIYASYVNASVATGITFPSVGGWNRSLFSKDIRVNVRIIKKTPEIMKSQKMKCLAREIRSKSHSSLTMVLRGGIEVYFV